MPKFIIAFALVLVSLAAVSADVSQKTPIAERAGSHDVAPTQQGLNPTCTIVYYNFCSGWIWLWSDWNAGDQVGVTFDLPTDCSWGNNIYYFCNIGSFWYWRYTAPGYGFTITYDLYETDASGCLSGSSHGSSTMDPVERWNFTGGLGCAYDVVPAVTATWDQGTLPYAATDNNASNLNAGPACISDPGTPGTGTSLQYAAAGSTVYCPPIAFADGVGYVDLIMASFFSCACYPDATKDASWGEIKSLFQ